MDVWRSYAVWLSTGALVALLAAGCASERPASPVRSPVDASSVAHGATVQLIVELNGAPTASHRPDASSTDRHRRVGEWVRRRGGQVFDSFRRAYYGLWVALPADQVTALKRLPEVRELHPVRAGRPCLDRSVSFIGADALRQTLTVSSATVSVARLSINGRVRIGIIDTGVDYTHAGLGGPGGFPNQKVVGGYDFAGDTFNPDPNDPRTWTPRPDPDPMDQNGHGSFVAGVAAGLGVPGKLAPGVAPGAQLYAYKVTGPGGQFITPLLVQAIERAMADGVDVLNLSLGTNFGPTSDPTIVACQNAAAAGIVVVAAAGNFGDISYSISSPAVAPSAIAVAASVDAGPGTFRVTEPADLVGNYLAVEGSLSRPLRGTGTRAGRLVYVGRACPGEPLLDDPEGRIALIDRGLCSFREKLLIAQMAGAIAVVMVNNVPGPPIRMEGESGGITIPAVMISLEDGDRLRAALAEGRFVSVVLAAREETDRLWMESSRGPALTSVALKPDLAAPGFRIFSVLAGSGTSGVAASGTSAAAPHVAGAAALLRQLHPDWSVEEIKALMMNTATPTTLENGELAPLSLQGAGRIRVDVAARTESVALGDAGTASLSFGFQAIEATKTISRSIRLRNKSAKPRRYVVEAELLGLTEDSLRVTVTPSGPIALEPGRETEIRVGLFMNPRDLGQAPPDGSRDGVVRITETSGSGEQLRVPFHVIPRPASRTTALLVGAGGGRGLVFIASSLVPSTAEVFAMGAEDPEDAGPENDIRFIGARQWPSRTVDDTRLDFAVATYRPWTTPDFVTYRVRIDVNDDGQYDATLYNVGGEAFIERLMGSPMATPAPFPAQIDPHSGVLIISARGRDLGLTARNSRFTYWVESTYGSASPRGTSPPWPMLPLWGPVDRTEKAKFDAVRPVYRVGAIGGPFLGSLHVGVTMDATQRARTPSPGLLILYPGDNPHVRQAQFVPM